MKYNIRVKKIPPDRWPQTHQSNISASANQVEGTASALAEQIQFNHLGVYLCSISKLSSPTCTTTQSIQETGTEVTRLNQNREMVVNCIQAILRKQITFRHKQILFKFAEAEASNCVTLYNYY